MFSIHPQDRDLELAEHRHGPDRVEQGDLLRRADDHGPGQRQALGQGQGTSPVPGREVDDEVVELAPFDLVEELLHDPVEHGPPHDHGTLGLEQEAHRHQLEAVGLDRHDPLAHRHRPPLGADQVGDRRPVDVGVHQADLRAVGLQAVGDRGGHGRLADAPFARANGDDVLDARDVPLLGNPLAPDVGSHVDGVSQLGPESCIESLADVPLDLGLERGRRGSST